MNKTTVITTVLTLMLLVASIGTAVADTITINNGNPYTNNPIVSVNITSNNGFVFITNLSTGLWNQVENVNYINLPQNIGVSEGNNVLKIYNGSSNISGFSIESFIPPQSNLNITSIILDVTKPVINIIFPINNSNYYENEIYGRGYIYNIIDANPAVPNATVSSQLLNTSIGNHSFSINAIDLAGNSNTTVIFYTVSTAPKSPGIIVRSLNRTSIVPGGSILVNLTASGSDFSVGSINETIPDIFTLTPLVNTSFIQVTNISQGGNRVYTFVGIGLYNISYVISTTSELYDKYNISGEFMDGSSPHSLRGDIEITKFYLSSADNDLYNHYDINVNGRLERNEVIDAVDDYFAGSVFFVDIIKIIIKYIAGVPF